MKPTIHLSAQLGHDVMDVAADLALDVAQCRHVRLEGDGCCLKRCHRHLAHRLSNNLTPEPSRDKFVSFHLSAGSIVIKYM